MKGRDEGDRVQSGESENSLIPESRSCSPATTKKISCCADLYREKERTLEPSHDEDDDNEQNPFDRTRKRGKVQGPRMIFFPCRKIEIGIRGDE